MSVAARGKQKPNRKSAIKNRKSFMAERVGFEPTERFPVHSISSAANSTTLAPLPGKNFGLRIAELEKRKNENSCQKEIRNPNSAFRNLLIRSCRAARPSHCIDAATYRETLRPSSRKKFLPNFSRYP